MKKDYQNLTNSITHAVALAKSEPEHFLKSDFAMVDMNITVQKSKSRNLDSALSELRVQCKLKVTDDNYHQLKFLLVNFVNILQQGEVLALGCPSSKKAIDDLVTDANPQGLKPSLVKVLAALQEHGFVIKQSSNDYVRKHIKEGTLYNRFLPTPKLFEEIIQKHRLMNLAIDFIPNANYVIVTRKKTLRKNEETKHELPIYSFNSADEIKVIKDSNAFLRAYNKLIKHTEITLSNSVPLVNQNKILYRKFCRGSLEFGGRFYGGFWQSLPSGKRGEKVSRKNILINGEPTVELDFKGLHINMLYAWEGLPPYDGDPYELENWPRELVKKCILIALNCKTKGHRAVLNEVKKEASLMPHYKSLLRGGYKKLKADFCIKHPRLEKYLHADVGINLQRQDSEIAQRVMCTMMTFASSKAIPVLPIHDSFICPLSRVNELDASMRGAYQFIMRTSTSPIIEGTEEELLKEAV